ncbi:hypothetical protein M758_UG276400, partial [Ceratodon purpureus]
VSDEPSHYSGRFNGTIHIVAGSGGRALQTFGPGLVILMDTELRADTNQGITDLTLPKRVHLSSSAADANLSCFTCDRRAQAPWTLQDEHRF